MNPSQILIITGIISSGLSIPFPGQGRPKPEKINPQPGEASGQLFYLRDDPSETRNLYLQYPEKVEELSNILKKYQETGQSR